MRTCILALTPTGAMLAQRLQAACVGETVVWLSKRAAAGLDAVAEAGEKRTVATDAIAGATVESAPAGAKAAQCVARTFMQVGPALREAFAAYEAVVAIMATGIVVRSLAPVLQDKLHDPAVIVFDERGRHGISLLAGHLGGANALTRTLCAAVGADPVLTTATDTEGLLAPDAVAAHLQLRPWPHANLQACNAALLAGADVSYMLAANLPHADFYRQTLVKLGVRMRDTAEQGELFTPVHEASDTAVRAADELAALAHTVAAEIVKAKSQPVWHVCLTAEQPAQAAPQTLYLLPRALWAGVGCRRGTTAAELRAALATACQSIGRDVSWLTGLASTTFKAEEPGLQEAAAQLQLPLHFYDNATLAAVIARYQLPCSAFVAQTIGIGNVCEAAALQAVAGQGRFALRKTKLGKVTVALVWQR